MRGRAGRSPHLPCGNTTGWLLPQVVMATTFLMCVATCAASSTVSQQPEAYQEPCRLFSSLLFVVEGMCTSYSTNVSGNQLHSEDRILARQTLLAPSHLFPLDRGWIL